jgi:XRE family transcriptional regulator, regulator of sulfur utilization
MDERKRLGARIKQLRQVRQETQERLAERIDINPKYLSSIERGEENPTLDLLIRLAKGLRVELYELFTFDSEGSPDQLRQKLTGLLADIPADELRQMVRVFEALVH